MNQNEIIEAIQNQSIRLDPEEGLDALIDAIGEARYVLLGEASHGTSEFYTLRTEISKRLIERKGFHFLAVEGDWPSCYRLNRYVKRYEGADDNAAAAMGDFTRWPTWMWANREVIALADWMREHNAGRAAAERVGFYGIDVYSLWESMEAIIEYLEQTGAPELEQAKAAFSCFEPFARSEQTYGISAAFLSESCENEVVKLLRDLQQKRGERRHADYQDGEESLSAELNALAAVNAERYYRSMVRGGPDSWNVRDRHMVEALNRLMKFHGSRAKTIIWEHNTHIGDARATDMAGEGMVNVGQLLREAYGDEVYAVGFGTHRGTVIAGREWGAPLQVMNVPRAEPGSWEDLLHRAGGYDKLLLLGSGHPLFQATLGHRAIGVVYHPEYERRGNYVPTRVAERYDAFLYVEESKALDPIKVGRVLV
ncbi:erythromycin esterase family protein [Tumebacillus sp. DT12]|uniref:Erythromycin esterase family protein n=1 Tax=Tumebacillus lacus TaxID=2995335 RepID=A0ABT3WX42_9BACL|nr:erythromycin esterase family protein [Tumebacillus lacus]MCX7569235.1 erythromycin esterase family protein [Tumebacillus lacus]